ncbi:MAG TPA: MerR family transcriptional regulator [Lachnospiraceae bacterium]|nr:MerR family transcriptional regulator [Lachnospiraceae bacterium]
MMTVHEVSELTGVSIRTLHYYDEIGLLTPSVTTDAGYRLYDETSLERLQDIMLFRELEFPLKDIKKIIDNPSFDKKKALEQQIELLKLKREHLDDLIKFATELKTKGVNRMSFKAFDTSKIDEYTKEAKKRWGNTDAFKEYEKKTTGTTDEDKKTMGDELMKMFAEFGELMTAGKKSGDAEVQAQVKKLQNKISADWYNCTNEILAGLGQMYAAGGEMTDNIDTAGGNGCAEFVAKAIEMWLISIDRLIEKGVK